MALRILGMGDVVSLVEEAKRKIDEKQAQKTAKKIQKGQFDLQDFRDQIQQMQQMGGIGGLLKNYPWDLNSHKPLSMKASLNNSPPSSIP